MDRKSILTHLREEGLYADPAKEDQLSYQARQEGFEFRHAVKLQRILREKREQLLLRLLDAPDSWRVYFSERIQAFMCWQEVPEEHRSLDKNHTEREQWRRHPDNFIV